MSALELVSKIRSGTDVSSAQAELYRLIRGAILPHLEKKIPAIVRPRLDTEDVLHDAFIRAMGALDRFEPTSEKAFFAWVYKIAKNLIADKLKRKRGTIYAVRFARGDDDRGPRESQIPARRRRTESMIQRREWIDNILGHLKPKEAEVIRLHQLDGYKFDEIALFWNKTPGAVQRFFSRAWHNFCELAQRESHP